MQQYNTVFNSILHILHYTSFEANNIFLLLMFTVAFTVS